MFVIMLSTNALHKNGRFDQPFLSIFYHRAHNRKLKDYPLLATPEALYVQMYVCLSYVIVSSLDINQENQDDQECPTSMGMFLMALIQTNTHVSYIFGIIRQNVVER